MHHMYCPCSNHRELIASDVWGWCSAAGTLYTVLTELLHHVDSLIADKAAHESHNIVMTAGSHHVDLLLKLALGFFRGAGTVKMQYLESYCLNVIKDCFVHLRADGFSLLILMECRWQSSTGCLVERAILSPRPLTGT